MADLVLVRVDNRLIHGQVVVKWLKRVGASKILVVDDWLAKDAFMSRVYAMAAPPGVEVEILDVATAVSHWKRDGLGTGRILVLFKDVAAAVSAWKSGFKFSSLQVGGAASPCGQKTVCGNITLDVQDIALLNEISQGGVHVTFQTLPEDELCTFQDLMNR